LTFLRDRLAFGFSSAPGKVDPDRFDAAIGAFVQRLCAGMAPAGRRRVLAVDGKGCSEITGPNVGVEQRRLEVVVDEVGPSLAWATAVVTRTSTRQPVAGSVVDEIGAEPTGEIEGVRSRSP
jgi:hypothetical protein